MSAQSQGKVTNIKQNLEYNSQQTPTDLDYIINIITIVRLKVKQTYHKF